MTSRAQMPLVIRRSHSENLTFSALLREQMQNEKRASDDETKNKAGRIPEATRSVRTSQTKTLIAAEAVTFRFKPLTHYLPRSDQ